MTGIPEWRLAPSLGVVLFFVLSGFLMARLYLGKRPTAREVENYVVARFARVYPLFASVILATCVLYFMTGSTPFGIQLGDFIPHLLLAGAGGTVWTISVEFQFYAAFVLMWVCIAALPKWRDEAVLAVTLASICIVLLFGYPQGRIDFLRYAHVFAIGMSAAVLLDRYGPAVRRFAPYLLPVSLIYYIAAFFLIPNFYDQNQVYGDIAACLACAILVLFASCASSEEYVARFLSTRVMVMMGELSFGIYLLHRMVNFVWKGIDPFGLGGLSKWVVIFLLTIFVSWVANRLIEVPARAAIRRWHRNLRGRSVESALG